MGSAELGFDDFPGVSPTSELPYDQCLTTQITPMDSVTLVTIVVAPPFLYILESVNAYSLVAAHKMPEVENRASEYC